MDMLQIGATNSQKNKTKHGNIFMLSNGNQWRNITAKCFKTQVHYINQTGHDLSTMSH